MEQWLLDSPTPSIRYFTLRDLLDKPEDDAEVVAAKKAIMQAGTVPAILDQIQEGKWWQRSSHYYTPKYNANHWTLLLLEEFGIAGDDERFQAAAHFTLDLQTRWFKELLAGEERNIACLWGNALRYYVRANLLDDERTQLMIRYLVEAVQRDAECEYNSGLGCGWGIIRSLYGLSALPQAYRSPDVQAALDRGVEFMLARHQLHEANYPADDKIHKLWHRLNFPLFYQADILFTLRVVEEIGQLDHPGAKPALEWLASKRKKNGRWQGSSPYRRYTWSELGDKEETDRWVSLHAARILRTAGM